MATPSMQIFMDSSDWLKGIVQDDTGTTNSSSPSSELIPGSKPPVIEKRLRPPHDQALKCPRCDSTHTKFCYYNNYSLSQPRYFCKTCRRYWTKGGTLRNVPVGGGCRKNKRSGGKKMVDLLPSVSLQEAAGLHQPFPLVHQLPHLEPFANASSRSIDFMECKYNFMLDNNSMDCLDLMDTKFGAIFSRSHLPIVGGVGGAGLGEPRHGFASPSFHDMQNETGFSIEGNHAALIEACQRLSLPFEGHHEEASAIEVKPSERILSMEWPEQCCGDVGREAMGFSDGIGSWAAAGMVNWGGGSSRPSELEFS